VRFLLGDKRSIPAGLLSAARLAQRMAEQGTPAWNLALAGDDARVLFTGVAAHTISRMPSMAPTARWCWPPSRTSPMRAA
jgi:hypothetical protein